MSLLRVIGLLFALVLAALAIDYGRASHRFSNQADELGPYRPVLTEVDFSYAGVSEVPFDHPRDWRHVEIILRIEGAGQSQQETLSGLKGEFLIIDEAGEKIHRWGLTCDEEQEYLPRHADDDVKEYLVGWLYNLPAGHFVLRTEIAEPAPALAHKKQILYARYAYYGQYMTMITGWIAAALGVAAIAITAIVIVPMALKRSRKS